MLIKLSFIGILALMFAFSSISAEEVEFFPCSHDNKSAEECVVSKVDISPCPQAKEEEPRPCHCVKGANSTVKFDFTPNFNSTSLYAQAYSETFLVDLPLPGQDTNACHFTSCPTVAGKKQTFEFALLIKDYYPEAHYITKWKLWNEKDEKCCFTVKIQIVSDSE